MPPRKIANPAEPTSLQKAIEFYYANSEAPMVKVYTRAGAPPHKITTYGYSIRRVAAMHQIAYSLLQRAVAAGGEIKTHSEAHEAQMVLTLNEEAALEEWCIHMHRWGYPIRLDILRGMAAAIVEDRKLLDAITMASLGSRS